MSKSTRQVAPAAGISQKSLFGRCVPYILLAPVFVYYAVFWLLPVISGMKEVFTDLDGNFTLLGNFRLMAESDLFNEAVMNTAAFAVISVLLQYLLALVLAVLLSRKFKGAKLLMFVAMIPMAITPTATAILWKTGLVRDGWINTILLNLHLISDPLVFMNVEGFQAVLTVVLIDTWTVTPSVMIILVAGLQGLQREMKEAAYTFGANKWQIFKDIVLPILKPSITTPFLVERIAFYVDVVPGVDTSTKLAFTYSFLTTVVVLLATVAYLKVSHNGTRKGGEQA